ncbi:hypothetical protein A2Y85_02175 [candidate division WOR-3 bacterium RBG_13_43_14]|uniref:FAD-dependent oxidoreductase n=1 Tax=candidate division WOR-3 bacterium RBG_13_43_14 TaxID=1802590 RepID=A0A1F4U8H4_UNCW3|nr:MAG: hypothetical protein A2Y85_02175 [candidate division WOR-3 bacterium RBG_13_43_14]
MMAAGQAANNGAEVILLEKMPALGRKLLLTGNGRCNFTNNRDIDEFYEYYGKNGQFLRNVFARFSNRDLIDFFKSQGVDTTIGENGNIFPDTGRSKDIFNCLLDFIQEQKVQILTNWPAKSVTIENNIVVDVVTNTEVFKCNSAIIATGGCSYPKTGSTGDGYKIINAIGHAVVPVRPGLVPLTGEELVIRKLHGISLPKVKVRLYIKDTMLAEHWGAMLFTNFGFSGPVILDLSCLVRPEHKDENIRLYIDLMPDYTKNEIDRAFLKCIHEHGRMNIVNILSSFLPLRIASFIIELCSISASMTGSEVSRGMRSKIIDKLGNIEFKVRGVRPLEEAMITIGGVALSEINPKTMASKLIKNLYLCGEIIDIAGVSGGYNLQAAFSTGYVAGESAAMTVRA